METILCGDALEQLRTLEPESVHTCATSPPYYNLRDYGAAGQIGMEETPEEYIAKLVAAAHISYEAKEKPPAPGADNTAQVVE